MSPVDPAPPSSDQAEAPVLRLVGDIDIASEALWRSEGDALLGADPAPDELVVDMSEVSFLDSRGMAMLVHLYTRMLEHGGVLVLTEVPRRVAKALSVAGLDELFELRAS